MLRRTLLGALTGTALTGGAATSAAAALPSVDVARLAVAAQAEFRGGDKPGLGDAPSTTLVQRALVARGFSTTVDGWYGPGTSAAYSRYQQSLGYSGTGANGLPGPTSLAKLGADRFTTTHRVVLGTTTDTYGGHRVNTRTRNMLSAADAVVSWGITLSQGSYNPGGDSSSRGTHDGGGVVDIAVAGLSTTQRWQTVRALRSVGFAAWYRNPSQGDWPYHLHAVAIGDTDTSRAAANQVADHHAGENGLADHAADDTPSSYRVPFTWWDRYAGL